MKTVFGDTLDINYTDSLIQNINVISNAKFINVEMTGNSGSGDYAAYIFCSDPNFVKTSIYDNSAGGIKLSCNETEIDHQLSSS